MFSKSRQSQSAESEARSVFDRGGQGNSGSGRSTFSVFGDDVVVTGNIQASVDLHIDGRVDGDVHCASLAQGQSSTINGNIVAETARISGTVVGSIVARELVIEASAQIRGDVTYETISIAQGGQIEGSFTYKAAGSMARNNPDLQLLAKPATEDVAA